MHYLQPSMTHVHLEKHLCKKGPQSNPRFHFDFLPYISALFMLLSWWQVFSMFIFIHVYILVSASVPMNHIGIHRLHLVAESSQGTVHNGLDQAVTG